MTLQIISIPAELMPLVITAGAIAYLALWAGQFMDDNGWF